jgi:cytochrome c5
MKRIFLYLLFAIALTNCSNNIFLVGNWAISVNHGNYQEEATMVINHDGKNYIGSINFYESGKITIDSLKVLENQIEGSLLIDKVNYQLKGQIDEERVSAQLISEKSSLPVSGERLSEEKVFIDRKNIEYNLSAKDLEKTEENLDHAGFISEFDVNTFFRGERIYNATCINCHGNEENEGSIPMSLKFWSERFKAGHDAFSMYQTVTRGFGSMPPQVSLSPQEKYDVIHYIQKEFVSKNKNVVFQKVSPGYLASLSKGNSRGPALKPYQPWADMDYGNFLINTYELVDEKTGLPRYHSPGPSPFPDEDYSKNNFANKGIAVRLDKGNGGVSKGKAWMVFDHDLMRVAGGFTGDGFMDWNGILLNDKHETYPRTIGTLHFETPVGPGWANPATGNFDDPRFVARDGRAFGPLPKSWANYKGLYHHEDQVIISYSVGESDVLEKFGFLEPSIFTRTLNISPSKSILKMRVAKATSQVKIKGKGAKLIEENGHVYVTINAEEPVKITLAIIPKDSGFNETSLVESESLLKYTLGKGKPHYPEILKTDVTEGKEDGPFAVDQLNIPFENPWACRMKLSGIDFFRDPNKAAACATDGDIWLISGFLNPDGELTWRRIGSGLFQPLGIKIVDEKIYVTCRDQLVLLRDLNGDLETDFYESFNHDHQVSDHFHEFAMGLQTDKEGNFYYAKSGRHAREALIPQHGTLLKVSADGSETNIIATGFRAANGVCINPDGSFIVTDQQGYWNPMNRINWVKGAGKFYGNMWGYNPPKDSSRAAMEQPLVWVDMNYDRSPSEMVWVESEKWGALNGGLLSLSYGYGKIQYVLNETVNGQEQGAVIDLPGVKFLTGVMRGRFNPLDGQLYACGMSAWGTNQMMRGGGLYRVRYTGKTIPIPVKMKIFEQKIVLEFDSTLDPMVAADVSNFEVKTWDLLRSKKYGSDRLNKKTLRITKAESQSNRLELSIDDLEKVDVITIDYKIKNSKGELLNGSIQGTIHELNNSF